MEQIVIVGAGIAGLSAAWELAQRGLRPIVLEQAARPGGVILTETIDGFVIDAGPDAFLTHKPAAIELARELGLGDRLVPTLTPRTAFVVRHERLIALPEASVLGLPTRLRPFITTRLFSWPGKLRMGLELLIPPKRDASDESIGSFIGRRFGQEAVTYLAEPLLAGIHAGDVNRLSMRAAFPRLVEAERSRGSVLRALGAMPPRSAPQSPFVSLPGGIGELTDMLLSRLPDDTVRCTSAVHKIEGRGPFRTVLNSGEEIQSRAVIAAVPAWAAASILATLDDTLASLCGHVPYVSSATIAFGVKREHVDHPLAGSGFVVPRRERRTLMAASWVSSKWPGRAPEGHVLLRAFLGGAYDPDILSRGDEELADAAFAELASRLNISGDPCLTRVYRWPRASAQHEVGHHERMQQIEQRLAALPGLFVTGSGYRGTGIPDCVADGRATGAKAAAFVG